LGSKVDKVFVHRQGDKTFLIAIDYYAASIFVTEAGSQGWREIKITDA